MNGDLYPTLLGPDWSTLPPIVRRLHQEGRALGHVTIEGGRSWPARALAHLMGFPPPGPNVATLLVVERRGSEQIWSRSFGGHTLSSRQRRGDAGLLLERFGSLECGFRLQTTVLGLDYDLVGTALVLGGLRLPLPRGLSPQGAATTRAEGDSMGLEVSLTAPFLGRILRYHGRVRPEGDEARA